MLPGNSREQLHDQAPFRTRENRSNLSDPNAAVHRVFLAGSSVQPPQEAYIHGNTRLSYPEIISQNNQENEQAPPLWGLLGRLVGASLGKNVI